MSVILGDCLEVMAGMEPESVDAIVTDPPYDLTGLSSAGFKTNFVGQPYKSSGFMNKAWDGTGIAFRRETWEAAYRVAKPSAYLLAFGGTRTVHRMTVALEDAGWIIRDMLVWAYLSGFPKSRANLKPAWEPIVLARKPGPLRMLDIEGCRMVSGPTAIMDAWENDASLCGLCAEGAENPARPGAPATRGYTTRRRVAQQPNDLGILGDTSRVATGCSHGTTPASGGSSSSTDGSGRTPTVLSLTGSSSTISTRTSSITGLRTCTCCGGPITRTTTSGTHFDTTTGLQAPTTSESIESVGRWPSNVLMVEPLLDEGWPGVIGGGSETSRVFVIPKADRADREPVLGGLPERVISVWGGEEDDLTPGKKSPRARRNQHPTVKPTDLMRHLVRLVTPTGGVVLDPFLGSGTTALAAEMEGFEWIGIEKEAEYVKIAEARLNGTQRGLGLPA